MGYGRNRQAALADRELVDAYLAGGGAVTRCKTGASGLGLTGRQWDRVVRAEDTPGTVADVEPEEQGA